MTVGGAYQGNDINMALFDVVTNPVDGVIHDNNTIRGKSVTIDTNIGDEDDAGYNKITAGAGGISMTGDIVSGNNALTAQGSSISIAGDIAGSDNTLKVEGDGDVKVTGDITGDKVRLEITGNGDMSTGEIRGDSASLMVAGTGRLETGEITGEGVQVDAKGMTLTSLNNMKGATMSVAGVNATLQDTNATLDASSITSTGDVNIGVDDAGSEETDVLSLKNGSSIAATNVVDGAGKVIYGNMKIDQNVSLDGDSSLSTTGGNVEVTGQVKGTSSSISTAGAGSVILGSIASATGGLLIEAGNGDIEVGTIEGGQGVDRLKITTNGSLSIGTSDNAALTNAQISAATGIKIGDTSGAGELLDIRGREGDDGGTIIKTDGNLVVNQSVSIHPGENESSTAGNVTVTAGGTMDFLGESTKIQGGDGNEATAYIKADGAITFINAKGAEIGQKATVESTGGDVTMTAGDAEKNSIAGVVNSAGMVSSTAGSTLIMGTESTRAEVNAKNGISIEGTGTADGNGVSYALLSTESGKISLVSPGGNVVINSEVQAGNGGVEMSGGSARVQDSYIKAGDAGVSITGTSAVVSNDSITTSGAVMIAGATSTRVDSVAVESGAGVVIGGDTAKGRTVMTDTSIDANGKVNIAGAAVKIVGNQGIDAGSGSVWITAHGADADADTPALQVHDGFISGSGNDGISLESKEGSALVKTVVISGKEVSISGKTGTTLASVEARDADSIKIGNGGETTVKMSSQLQADNNIEIVGDSATVAGSCVTSLDGEVKVAGSTLAKVLDVEVSGKQVEITGATVSVTGSTIEGKTSVVVDGTTTTNVADTTIMNSGKVSIGETGTGATTVKSTSIAASGVVSVAGDSVTITDNLGITSTGGDVTITANAGDASITGDEVEADGEVSISATGTATLSNMKIEGGDNVTINAETVKVTGNKGIISEMGRVEVIGSNGEVSITGGKVSAAEAVALAGALGTLIDEVKIDGKSISVGNSGETTIRNKSTLAATDKIDVAGDSVNIEDAFIESTMGNVEIVGQGTAELSDTSVSGKKVELSGGDITVVDGSTVQATGTDIIVKAASLTIGTQGETVPDDFMTAKRNVDITVTDGTTIQGAAQVKAEGGAVTINGGTTAANTITGENTRVDAAFGSVSLSGNSNEVSDKAKVSAAKEIRMTSEARNLVASGAEVTSDSVTMEGGTDGRNVIKGAGTLVDASALTMKGKENTIKEGAEVKDAKLVSMTSDALNQIASGAKVASDSVSMEGGTDGRNVIKGAGTLVDAGMVTMKGKENTIKEGATVLAGSTVDMTATTSNAILSGATVKAEGGAVTIGGGTTAANTIEGADTLVDAATNVDIDGALNTIQEGAAVMAGTNVTIDAATGNVVQGGATVTAGTSIEITAVGTAEYNGNLISDATLTATTGDINVTAAKGNEIASGAKLTATSGKVTITGTSVNLVSGADTTVTAGAVIIAGGETAINVVDAATVDAVGDAGTVDMDGATNIIQNGALVLADADITMDSNSAVAGNGNLVSASVLETENGNIELTSQLVNVIKEAARVEAIDGAVTMQGESNLIANGAEVLATGNIMIASAGTDATSGNVIDASTVQTETGNIDIQAANINLVKNGSSVNALTGKVTMKGVANLITTNAEVLAETGIDITSTGSGDNHGNKVSASTVQTETGNVDITATMHNHVTDKAGVTATNGGVNLRGKSNTIDAAAHVNAGDVAFIMADEKNTITGEDTKVTAGRTAWIQGADNEISAGALVEGKAYATIKATGDNTITGAGTKVKAGVTAQVFGENNEISAGALVNGDQYVMINAAEHNRIFGAKTVVQGGNNVQIIAGTYNVVDAASVKTTEQGGVALRAKENNIVQNGALVNTRGGSITLTSVGDDATVANTVRGEGTRLAAETYVKLDGVGNTVSSGADIRAVQEVYMTATEDNVISDSGTQVYAGAAVSLEGKNNTITKDAVVIGLTGVSANADENNFITEGAKVFALNDDASVTLTAGVVNQIAGAATEVYAGADVSMTAETINLIDAATVTAMNGEVTMGNAAGTPDTVVNSIQAAATVTAGTDVRMTGDINNILTGSSVSATQSVTMTGATQNAISESTVKAGTDVTLTGDKATVDNVITESTVTAGNNLFMTGENNTITETSAVNVGNDATLDAGNNNVINGASKLTAVGSVDMDAVAGNIISDSGTQVYAGEKVSIDGGNNIVTKEAKVIGMKGVEITAAEDNTINASAQVLAMNDDASVAITAGEDNLIAGSATKVYAGKDVSITGEVTNTVYAASVTAKTRNITMGNAAGSTDDVVNTITAAAKVTAAYYVAMTGDKNAILAGSTVTAGMDVTMTADTQNAVANSTVTANNGSITIGDVDGSTETVQNVITSEAGKTTTLTAKQNVTITGENIISSTDLGSTSIIAENDNIIINDDNYIKYAVIAAQGAEGDVDITTGTGDKNTWIEDTSITGETVTVAGDTSDDRSAANLAVVKGAETEITSRGEDDGVGITLNNVSVLDTEKGASNIIAEAGGNIVLLNRVDVENSTLTIEDGMTSDARIVLDAGNVLNTKEASSLEGRLTGEGDINKSGGDDLLLDYDHTEFNGTIYANGAVGGAEGSVVDASNVGSWIEITSEKVGADQMAGVGEDATIVLKSTDLVINTTEARIGTLDTTQDEAGVNNVHATGGTLVSQGGNSDGSYTMDDNTRVDFTTVGSVLEVNMGTNGDVVHATNMKLSDATLLKLDATVDGAGQASSDIIEASGTIDVVAKAGLNSTSTATAPSTARVYINHTDMAAAAKAAEGARTTIMSGTMVTSINEDVLYDVAQSANGTYQRELLDRNVHLENKGDQVDLVYSKNYRSASKTPQMQQVANALKEISDTFHHSEGTLAASNNRLHNLIDAFDYTRSEGAAQRGLQSVAGTSLVLPRLMMFDSSRRHLENLRGQMLMPVCADMSGKGGEVRRNNVWMTYTGSHDELCGDAYLEDYSRSANGAMLGIDRSVNCKLRVGLSLGYEESTGKSGSSRIEADTFFVDAYAAGVTGRFKHRASVGLATSSFDTDRSVLVEAGYHTFAGTGKGSVDSLSLNFGYEISTDYKLSETATLTPYAALNLSWHKLDTLREQGMGEAGLVTEYDDEWQSEIILGVSYNRLFTVLRNQAPALFYADAAMHLELFNDRVSVKNRFQGASSSWRAESMNRQPLYFELGVGVAVPLSPGWTATAGAAYEIGPDRAGVSGNVGVRYQF